jgi:nitronate monooxygenase
MSPVSRAETFAKRLGIARPILLAPMAGACPAELSIAVANAGGLGACGALLMTPDQILAWAKTVRGESNGAFQINLWVPDPAPERDDARETRVRRFLEKWGPAVLPEAGLATPLNFEDQCEALIAAGTPVVSSVMGLFPAPFVQKLKSKGVTWVAAVSTLGEALAAEEAGADVIAVQGAEAGGHRAAFDASYAESALVGLMSLLPVVVDAVKVPVVATGGIADGRGVAAALALGASAVQVGTAFLRCPEAGIPSAWSEAIGQTPPESTLVSRVFSGRPGRSIANAYAKAATASDAPAPAPYPVQRALTAAMRDKAAKANRIDAIQAWSGQSGLLTRAMPARELVELLWDGAQQILR